MKCSKCSRHENAATVCISATGNMEGEVMFIYESPSIESDLCGVGFEGKQFDYMKDLMTKRGLKPKEYIYTHLVRCHSYDKPVKAQIEACKDYLLYEINKYKPKYIITMGNEAMKGLIGKSGITKYRGKEMKYSFTFENSKGSWEHEAVVIPFLSPSATMQYPKFKKMFTADLTKLFNMLYGNVKQPHHEIVYVMDKQKLVKAINHCNKYEGPIGFDLETMGFDPNLPDKHILTMSLSPGPNISYAIPLGHPESPWKSGYTTVLQYFKRVLETHLIVPQNGKFDAKWLKSKADINMRFYFDTLLASYLLDENTPHNLEYLSQVYLNVPSYKSMVDQSRLAEEPLKLVLKYNALDTHYTVRLHDPLMEGLKKSPRLLNLFNKLMMPAFEMYTDIELHGIYVHKQQLMEQRHKTLQAITQIEKDIQQYVSPEFVDKYLTKRYKTKEDKILPFNMNSPKQMASLLFEQPPVGLGFHPTITTGTGAPSTSEEAIIYLKDEVQHPLIDLLSDHRAQEQQRKMFLDPWTEKLGKGDRLHPNFKLFTVTGRTSCENPNIQQVPRDPAIRGLIGAPPGKLFMEMDYSQVELRVAAHIANERNMKYIYQTGGDIHTRTAAGTTGKPEADVTKEERKAAKATNFGYLYGAWWTTYKRSAKQKYGLDLTDEEAMLHREAFFQTYPDLIKWHSDARMMVRKLGKVIYPNGRERRLPDIKSTNKSAVQAAEREAINSPVQGFASDITILSAITIWNKYIKGVPIKDREISIIATVHDAIMFEVDEDKWKKWARIVKTEMENIERLERVFNVKMSVPLIADCKVGNSWGYSEEVDIDAIQG